MCDAEFPYLETLHCYMSQPKTPSQEWNGPPSDTPRPFDLVSQNLKAIGAIPIHAFLNASFSGSSAHETSCRPDLPSSKFPSPPPTPPHTAPNTPPPTNMTQNVVRLHQTCQRAFGTSGALKFEVLEEDGPDSTHPRNRTVSNMC